MMGHNCDHLLIQLGLGSRSSEVGDRYMKQGMNKLGRKLTQRFQHETALMQPGMGEY
jgi:hypothetical protein